MKGATYCIFTLILISSAFCDRIPQRNEPLKKYLGGLEHRNSALEPSIPLYTNSYEDPSVYYEPCQSFGFLFKSLSALLRIIPPIFAYGQVLSLLFASCSASTVTTTSTSASVTFNTVTDTSTTTSTSLSTTQQRETT